MRAGLLALSVGHVCQAHCLARLRSVEPVLPHSVLRQAPHLRGMGSVPRGRLSRISSLRLVSFCRRATARDASSSSSCHLLICCMLR